MRAARGVREGLRLTSVACGGRGRALTWRVAGRTGRGTLLRWRAGTGRDGRRGGRADAGGSAAEVSLSALLFLFRAH